MLLSLLFRQCDIFVNVFHAVFYGSHAVLRDYHIKLNIHMKFDDEYSLHLLYELAGKPPYPRLPSFVVPQAKFQPDFPQPPKKPFVPDPILTLWGGWNVRLYHA